MATTTHKKKTTAKKPAAKPKVSAQSQSWANQAALEALVRYQPQASVLEQAYNDAQQTYQQKVEAAKNFAALQARSIAQAAPAVDESYGKAATAQGAVNSLLQQQLGQLPAGANAAAFQTAQQLGAGTAASNLVGEQARAKDSFGQQAVQATQGAGFQASQAHDSLVGDLTKILSQKQDLASQQGAFQALTYDQLHQAASKLTHDTNIHKLDNASAKTIAAGHDTTSAANTAARIKAGTNGKKSATGATLLPGGAHNTFRSGYDSATSYLASDPPPANATPEQRRAAITALTKGRKGSAVYEDVPAPTSANPNATKRVPKLAADGTVVTSKDVPKVPALEARAAVEQQIDGHISRGTQKKLADAGYSIKQLNLTTYAQWRKHGGPRKKKVADASSTIGGITAAIGKLTGTG